jgi:hypothetical protein
MIAICQTLLDRMRASRSLPLQQSNRLITVDIGRGRSIRVDLNFDAEALARVLDVLDRVR